MPRWHISRQSDFIAPFYREVGENQSSMCLLWRPAVLAGAWQTLVPTLIPHNDSRQLEAVPVMSKCPYLFRLSPV